MYLHETCKKRKKKEKEKKRGIIVVILCNCFTGNCWQGQNGGHHGHTRQREWNKIPKPSVGIFQKGQESHIATVFCKNLSWLWNSSVTSEGEHITLLRFSIAKVIFLYNKKATFLLGRKKWKSKVVLSVVNRK